MLDPLNASFLATRLAPLPMEWQEPIRRRYEAAITKALTIHAGTGRQSEALRDSNRWLSRITHKAARAWIKPGATDSDIRDLSREKADDMWRQSSFVHNLETLRGIMSERCLRLGITPPSPRIRDWPAIKRMTNAQWWRRKIRRTQAAMIEEIAIELGYVNRRRQCYCSDETVSRRRAQIRRNALTLEAIELENQFGFTALLSDLAARSVSNPHIKRAELMTRISGFESIGRYLGHVAIFVTVTCPSRFHAVLDSGRRNPKHDGSSPREGQAHLVKAWAKCRAALHRRGVRMYGFRVAEPHHDGCPHWHMVLFIDPRHAEKMKALTLRYFLEQHSPDETGARKNRVQFVDIDYERGSAAAYIAKYITKSIDGEHLDADDFGNSGKSAAERVTAWASAHGIRQFQQIGGPPVTPWRELRRVESDSSMPATTLAAQSAADAGNWARYVDLQGGPTVARKDLAITLARTDEGERLDPDTGATFPALNQYGEPAAPAIYGVRDSATGRAVLTRRYRWATRQAPAPDTEARLRVAPWRAQRDTGKAEGRAAWTRVNNCTDGSANERAGRFPKNERRPDWRRFNPQAAPLPAETSPEIAP